jgi:hypothetical protein
MIALAVAAAGAFVWRFTSLMATRNQKLAVLWGLTAGTTVLVTTAVIKGNSVNHALLLFSDTMVAMVAGSVPLGREMRRLRHVNSDTSVTLGQVDAKYGTRMAWIILAVATLLIVGEYALAAYV